ncbi:ABC-F family ATP-binding cassette domain-containing protein [Peloplasma aerotolerans]|uniref:ABC-F family ATP-binding cassette domain-containing protein n=1 Tax=Peloplasma aerotolerans TaxID=3044389 RepID=A0AAW6U939_9MOLU|nr:ABC-F family ATP-binding cassette domain-containing protein [Mariniplasma sp. M4Ah]MDI6453179.1 ABC-F family ATP-binding cassette domain-containing protein [Mariniplasma sp. M4Ah]
MSILEVENITFSYGGEKLYQKASMRLFEGEHAVLVGPNGTGKTTLLKLLDKSISPDQGTISWIPNKKIGYLDQYAKINPNLLVKTYLYDAFLPLFEKEKEMERLYESLVIAPEKEHERILNWASTLGDQLIESDFYAIKSKVGNIIHGLGLTMDLLEEPIKHLSGGMRAKIILGKLLLEESDILLLDEPTNFLDVRHIEWLTKFLINYPKAFLVVSHHEEFLMDIANTVFALENGTITRYKGDYEYYLKERELRIEQQQKAFVSQQKFIQKTEEFIQKNITRAKTTKRAQSRRKMLAKIDKIVAPKHDKTYHFHFPLSSTTGKDVLSIENLEIGYLEPLLEPLNIDILKQEKAVITGKNGIGKSTFIKTILGIVPELGGSYRWIDTAKIAYFAQDSKFEDGLTPFQIVHHRYQHFTKKEVMSLLGNHGINFDMANRDINTLSGGEQTKVRLALLRHQKGNVLILDEPTNHLDVNAKEALKEALMSYEGTLILVSHEKEFYQDICDYEISLYDV